MGICAWAAFPPGELLDKSADMAHPVELFSERTAVVGLWFGVNDGAQDCRDHQCPLHQQAIVSSGRIRRYFA